mmetsp:Transcript_14294/g.32466  ORF Transcript_14294/g.32466 Transcript_14294/m.32466 type:complete len:242 (+) Transcript_14294:127-852(+)
MDALPRQRMKRSSSASLVASPTSELTFSNQFKAKSFSSRKSPPRHALNSFSQTFHKPFEQAYSELAKQRNLRKLEVLFVEADTDGSGEMSLDEFHEALRKPWIQRTFSSLGVQPHQSELVFRSLVKGKYPDAELSIHAFIEGLTALVGTSIDGTGRELDVELMKPTREARIRREQASSDMVGPSPLRRGSERSASSTGMASLGAVHLLPEAVIQRAVVHSATAQALQPPTSVKRPVRRSVA